MRVLKVIPLLCILLLALIPACKEQTPTVPMSNIENVTYGYSIDYPQNWTKNDSVSYQFSATSPETTTGSGSVENSLAGLIVSVSITKSEKIIPLEEYYQSVFDSFSESPEAEVTEFSAKSTTFGQGISGYVAAWEISDSMGDWNINWYLSDIHGSFSYYYSIMTFAHKDASKEYKATLISAIDSFKYIDITVTPTVPKKVYSELPPMTINVNKQYIVTMTTKYGDMVFQLFPADAPQTVNSFVFLIREGFYDDTVFHRVDANFVVQGGDPSGTGLGSPGYYVPNEISSRQHLAGTLSMANSGADTNGSQFFICYGPQPTLDGNYSVFGQLIQGTDVLNKISLNDKLIKVTVTEQ